VIFLLGDLFSFVLLPQSHLNIDWVDILLASLLGSFFVILTWEFLSEDKNNKIN
tara:strand:+ start:25 stop:186 length:162 start_codon:yes stop_codon:yes gene_type:complete